MPWLILTKPVGMSLAAISAWLCPLEWRNAGVCVQPQPRMRSMLRSADLQDKNGNIAIRSSPRYGNPDMLPPVPKLKYLDRFLRRDCCADLLGMSLFPAAKEICESMAILHAIDKVLLARFADPNTVGIVVGDGSSPRTAALLAVETKWQRVVSVDPDMLGLPLPGCEFPEPLDEASATSRQLQLRRKRQRRQHQLSQIANLERLEVVPRCIQDVCIDVTQAGCSQIIVALPHAHVAPEEAVKQLRFPIAWLRQRTLPKISVIQVPCCKFVKRDRIWNCVADEEYVDEDMLTQERCVRVWHDVSAIGLAARAFHDVAT